jgi:hypothetical protein
MPEMAVLAFIYADRSIRKLAFQNFTGDFSSTPGFVWDFVATHTLFAVFGSHFSILVQQLEKNSSRIFTIYKNIETKPKSIVNKNPLMVGCMLVLKKKTIINNSIPTITNVIDNVTKSSSRYFRKSENPMMEHIILRANSICCNDSNIISSTSSSRILISRVLLIPTLLVMEHTR